MTSFFSVIAIAALLAAPAAPQAKNVDSEKKPPAAQQEKVSAQPAGEAASHSNSAADHDHRVSLDELGTALGHAHQHHHGGAGAQLSAEEAARQQEMNSLTKEKLQALVNFHQALLAGDNYPTAVQKAGVPITDLDRLAFLAERYYPARAAALDIQADIDSLNASASEKNADNKFRKYRLKSLQKKLAAHERFRGQFFSQIKPENRALVDQFEPVFVDLVRKREALLEKQREEARAEAIRSFSPKSVPGLIAYLKAKGDGKSDAEAIAASGLSEKAIIGLSEMASKYLIRKRAVKEAEAEIPKVKARGDEKTKAGQSAAFEIRLAQEYQSRIDGFAEFQKKFAEMYGEALQKDLEAQFEALSAAYRHGEKPQPSGGIR